MPQPWSAEWTVTAALAQSLIEKQFPQLAPAGAELLGAGWDNTAFRVNNRYVFRFPRRQFAVPFIEAETQLLPFIAPCVPLPIPVPTFIGHPAGDYPWPFAGYPMIPGRTACAAVLDDDERAAVGVATARFLAALHAIPAAEAARHGAGPDPIARLDPAGRIPWARENLHQLAQRYLIEDIRPFTAILDTAPATYAPRSDILVHGDFYFRHLLVGPDHQLAGVIDWGDVHLGDPASDLMIAHSFLQPTAQATFRKAYGPIDNATWHMARLRALWHTLIVMDYGHAIGDANLVRESRLELTNLALAGEEIA